jgi:argininosuccinate lyase
MKLWGGRFTGRTDPEFEKFSESFSVDHRLVLYDLKVNLAYVEALGEAHVLNEADVRRLRRGLGSVRRYVMQHPNWAADETAEDIHTWVEARLEKEAGEVARKLRTGRSRNDLVATETRLYVKDATTQLESGVCGFLQALLAQARTHLNVVVPGYTHLQPAQPILFSHYLLAYVEMLLRDASRFEDCRDRADELPMGAGALAGTTFPVNRERLARQLGFARVSRNSLDATSDRDFVCELLFACALTLTHLSRWAEDMIIQSSPGFGYIEIADTYSTGSSLMPQKKNPDSLELIRGKSAGVLGRLTSTLALLKGLPLAYNRDLQEDKPALFEGVDTTCQALRIAARVASTLKVNPDRMRDATSLGFLTATDLADELVRRGVPFAEAHEQVGKLVQYCVRTQKTFGDLSSSEAVQFLPGWDARLAAIAQDPNRAIERRDITGGTAHSQVLKQIAWGEKRLVTLRRELERRILRSSGRRS